MKIKFFGHNCYLLEGQNFAILVDPWFSPNGAFLGSWHQWPPCSHLLEDLITIIKRRKKCFLFISHEHQDHFDVITLSKLKQYIDQLIIPNFCDKHLFSKCKSIGYNVLELDDEEVFQINNNDFIKVYIVDVGINHDSAILIRINNKTFLNQNDCKIFDRIRSLSSMNIDYYAVQFSGATWHPVCFNMTEKRKVAVSKGKVVSKLTAIRNAVRLLKPKVFFPSAGPAIFPHLDPELSLGKDNIFVHQTVLTKFLKNESLKICHLRPGDEYVSKMETSPINPPTLEEFFHIRNNFSCEYFNYSKPLIIDNLILAIRSRLDAIEGIKFEKCPTIYFRWYDGGLQINLNELTIKEWNIRNPIKEETYFLLEADKKYFAIMADDNYRWQDIYLSLRAKVTRHPDVFSNFINLFLFSDASNIKESFLTTLNIQSERIVVCNPISGKMYEINRYCPHNGADLSNASIDDKGHLICPRHNWLFNLDNGGLCNSSNQTIDAVEVKEVITLCDLINLRLID